MLAYIASTSLTEQLPIFPYVLKGVVYFEATDAEEIMAIVYMTLPNSLL